MASITRSRTRLEYKWWVTIAVGLGMLMSMIDSTIVNIAIPVMQHAFGANLHDVQWVVTIYMLTQAAVIPLAPYLTATLGGKRAYLWSLSAFVLGSLLCGFAWNLPSLVIFRFLQGIGGGVLLPMVMILQYQAFPHEERGKATSTMGIAMMVAPTLGPVLGGYLVSSFGWQWAFFINVPVGIIAVILALRVLKPMPGLPGTRFDGIGFLTAAAGCAVLLYAVPAIVSAGATIWNILFLVTAFVLLLIFVENEFRQTRRGQEPLLDLRRFKDRTFTFSILAQIIVFFVWFGVLFLIPIYLQTLHQETPLRAGIIQGAISLSTLIILPIGGWLADRIGPRSTVIPGLLLLACALALMMNLALNTPIWMIVCLLFLLGGASGMTNQIAVSALSQIKREEEREITNATTLLSVLRAAAAPMGVAIIASFVQARSQLYMPKLSAQGLAGSLLQHQSYLFAMHEGFLVTAILALIALVAMCCVPRRKKTLTAESM